MDRRKFLETMVTASAGAALNLPATVEAQRTGSPRSRLLDHSLDGIPNQQLIVAHELVTRFADSQGLYPTDIREIAMSRAVIDYILSAVQDRAGNVVTIELTNIENNVTTLPLVLIVNGFLTQEERTALATVVFQQRGSQHSISVYDSNNLSESNLTGQIQNSVATYPSSAILKISVLSNTQPEQGQAGVVLGSDTYTEYLPPIAIAAEPSHVDATPMQFGQSLWVNGRLLTRMGSNVISQQSSTNALQLFDFASEEN